jgi:hypothetical protein
LYEPAGTGVAVTVAFVPAHTVGLLTETVGLAFTTTVVVAVAIQPRLFIVNVYRPAAAAVAGKVGF